MAPGFLAPLISNGFHCGPIGWAFVRHHEMWIAVSPDCFLREIQRSGFSAFRRGIGFQYFPFMIDGASQAMPFIPGLHEYIVQVPLPLQAPPHRFGTRYPDLVCDIHPDPVDPKPDAFVADMHAALVKRVL